VKTGGDRFIDLAQALTVINKKQYHQTSSKGVPLCYAYTIQSIHQDAAFPVITLPRTWCVRNSIVKLHAGWRKQMKDSGFKLKDLSPYGRRLRVAFTDDAVHPSGQPLVYLEPYNQQSLSTDGSLSAVFQEYTSPDGATVNYSLASEYTTIVVPSDAEGTAPMELPACMLSQTTGATSSHFRVVGQYLRSRNMMREDQSPDDSTLDPSNFLVRLFSGAQPETDEIITEAQEFQDVRPYTMELDSSANFAAEFETSSPCNVFDQNTGAGEISVVSGVAPLGLLCLGDIDGSGSTTTALDQFIITVHAIYEM
jgi:hypothetical protein